jgi:hypothetical protein
MSDKIDKHFVSNIDKFLEKLRKEVPESASQRAEREKYERINYLRDHPVQELNAPELWEDF